MRAEDAILNTSAGLIKASCDTGIITIYRSEGSSPAYDVRFVPRGPDHSLNMENMTLVGSYSTLDQAQAEASSRFSVASDAWLPQTQVELVEDRDTGGLHVEPQH